MANIFPNPDGRNKIEFSDNDWKKIYNLCSIFCTGEEIASIMDVSYDTLEKRIRETYKISFTDFYKKHSSNGKASIRRQQYIQAVEEGNTALLIWLGKNYLGQRDNVELSGGEPIKLLYNLADRPELPERDVSESDSGTEET